MKQKMQSSPRLSSNRKRQMGQQMMKGGWSVFRALLLIGLAYVLIYPILYMISMSFRNINDMYDVTVNWIPKHFTLDTIQRVWKAMDYPKTLLNTVVLAAGCAAGSVITCSLAAYGLSRFKFPGQKIMFVMVVFTIIVPQSFYNMPTYMNFRQFNPYGLGNIWKLFTGEYPNLLGTSWTMLIPAFLGVGIRAGLYIYLFRQFFKGMPRELEEAAYIDGCGYLKTFLKIMVPSAISVFVTVILFSVVWYWNDYQISNLLLGEQHYTLSSALSVIDNLIYSMETDAGIQKVDTVRMALDRQGACLLVIAPVLVIYLSLQRFFVESIERTGLVE